MAFGRLFPVDHPDSREASPERLRAPFCVCVCCVCAVRNVYHDRKRVCIACIMHVAPPSVDGCDESLRAPGRA